MQIFKQITNVSSLIGGSLMLVGFVQLLFFLRHQLSHYLSNVVAAPARRLATVCIAVACLPAVLFLLAFIVGVAIIDPYFHELTPTIGPYVSDFITVTTYATSFAAFVFLLLHIRKQQTSSEATDSTKQD